MIRNTTESWGWPARAIHWIVAVLVLGLFAQGLLMEDLPREQQLYQTWLHAAFGISLLLVAAAGFVWWLVNPVPAEPAATPAWQGHAARLAHWGLYGLIFLTTIAGWALTGAMRTPVAIELFGFIEVPQLLAPGSGYHEVLEEAHELASYLLIALAGVHVMAALYHHLVLRDGVLLRMLGRTPKPERP